jgi:deoxyribodipyrimidine photo-lyase
MMNDSPAAGQAYLRQIGWREFAYYALHHHPESPQKALRRPFDAFPWRMDQKRFNAWKRGATGYPLVDAGMRELRRTGWMHNRVRMVVASFLVKHLLIGWQDGAAWFWDTLVDADLAINTFGWQWVAGCGADAAPYFRIFNPALQARRFDPQGEYVRRWVPEQEAGEEYPPPIVGHHAAREGALEALASIGKK